MHARAERAFQVVEVDHRHLGCRVAADGPSRDWDRVGRIFGQVERVQMHKLGVIGRDQKVDYLGLCPVCDGDGQGFVARKLAWLACPDAHAVIRRQVVLRANQNLNAAVENGVGPGGRLLCALQPAVRPTRTSSPATKRIRGNVISSQERILQAATSPALSRRLFSRSLVMDGRAPLRKATPTVHGFSNH